MLICTCCPNPRVTNNLRNAIEVPDDFTIRDAEEGSVEIPGEELERRGLILLEGFWHTPNLQTINGRYSIEKKCFI